MKEIPIKELLDFSIINIDKPSGPTSFTVSAFVKNSFGLKKTGHLGTLDPQVSGVLPVALNRACRLDDYLMHKDKQYVGIMRLHEDINDKVLQEKIKNFIGKIVQLPPIRSRVKRAERVREIKEFKILERNEKDILFSTTVQAGTYIRKLIHDIGEQIGGAHMLELRRIRAGLFYEDEAVNLYDFDKAVNEYEKGNEELLRKILIPAAEIIKKTMPGIKVKSSSMKKLLIGKPLMKSDLDVKLPREDIFAVFCEDKFIGIYKKLDSGDIVAKPEFILN